MKFTAHEFVKAANSVKPKDHGASTVTGTGVDCQGYDDALVLLETGTATATGTLTVAIQESDPVFQRLLKSS